MSNNQDEKFSLAQFFADIILSRHNQFCSVRIVGTAGKGKSWFAVDLCMEVAKIVAKHYNEPVEKYFDFDDAHMSVMSPDSLKTTMANPVKNSILLQDDVAVVLNSRRFMSDNNIEFNDTFQTWRPQHNLLVQTFQTGALVDKVVRILAHYEIEMVTNFFDEGISIAKVQEIKLDHKTGFIYYPFIQDKHGNKITRVISKAPDKAVTDKYESIRAVMLQKLKDRQDTTEEPIVYNNNKITKEQLLEPDIIEVHTKYIKNETESNVRGMQTKIAKIVSDSNRFKIKCTQQLVYRVLNKHNLLPPPPS